MNKTNELAEIIRRVITVYHALLVTPADNHGYPLPEPGFRALNISWRESFSFFSASFLSLLLKNVQLADQWLKWEKWGRLARSILANIEWFRIIRSWIIDWNMHISLVHSYKLFELVWLHTPNFLIVGWVSSCPCSKQTGEKCGNLAYVSKLFKTCITLWSCSRLHCQ